MDSCTYLKTRRAFCLLLCLFITLPTAWFKSTSISDNELMEAYFSSQNSELTGTPHSLKICNIKPRDGHVLMDISYLIHAIGKNERSFLIPFHDGKCLPQHFSGQIDFMMMDTATGEALSLYDSLNVELVRSANSYSLEEIKNSESLSKLYIAEMPKDASTSSEKNSIPDNDQYYYWVGVSLKDFNILKATNGTPLWHPSAKIIDVSEFKKISSSTHVLDLSLGRDTHRFLDSTVHIHSLPGDFSKYRKRESHIADELELKELTKESPLILVSDNELDYLPYNIANALYTKGYTNLYIFRQGIDILKNIKAETPLIPGLAIIDSIEAKHLEKKGRVSFIDLRRHRAYSEYSLESSIHLEIRKSYRTKDLKEYIDLMNGPVIIYGKNEYDWPTYNQISKLVEEYPETKRNIYWLRKGLHDVQHFNRVHHLTNFKPYPLKFSNIEAQGPSLPPNPHFKYMLREEISRKPASPQPSGFPYKEHPEKD